MSSPFFIPIDYEPLLHMENMNAGFIAEGRTVVWRAIDAYMKKRGTSGDEKALELLHALDRALSVWNETDRDKVLGIRTKLGQLVGERGFDPLTVMRPEASPLALLGMAWYSLDFRFGQFNLSNAFEYLMTAQDYGCNAGLGTYANALLRDRVTPECWALKSCLTDCLKKPSEDFLLVAGQCIARWDLVDESFASKIRKGLKKLAQKGHVDALRMLALSHSVNVRPENTWARREILARAQKGEPWAMLIRAQRLACLLHFWDPDQEYCESMAEARALLEKDAQACGPWGLLTHAHVLLSQDPETDPKVRTRNEQRALEILECLVREHDFAPARAMLGVRHYTDGNPKLAWPYLRDACRQNFSPSCEAACADFLAAMTMHARHAEDAKQDLPCPSCSGSTDPDEHGGCRQWLDELGSVGGGSLFGTVPLTGLSMMLRLNLLPTDKADFDLEARSRKLAATYEGNAAIFAYLLNLGQKDSPDVLEWRERLLSLIQSSASRGNEACILANIFFRKLLYVKGFRTYVLLDLGTLCESMGPATNLARATTCVTGLLAVLAQEEEGAPLLDMDRSVPMQMLLSEYTKAVQLNDIPFLCLLPILFKMAEEQFPKPVVQATLDLVSQGLHGRKEDLHDFMASVGERIAAPGLNLALLWHNLGFKLGVDCPGTLPLRSSGDDASDADSFELDFLDSLDDDAWEDDFPDWDDGHDDHDYNSHDVFENREKFFERSEAISRSVRQLHEVLVQINKLTEDRAEKKTKRGRTRKTRGKR